MIDAMKQALEALEGWDNYGNWVWPETALEQCKRNTKESLTALRQAIEQAEKQEPIGYLCENAVGHKYFRWKKPTSTYNPIALYTAPPRKEWVGLTDDEFWNLWLKTAPRDDLSLCRAIEAKLKERNT